MLGALLLVIAVWPVQCTVALPKDLLLRSAGGGGATDTVAPSPNRTKMCQTNNITIESERRAVQIDRGPSDSNSKGARSEPAQYEAVIEGSRSVHSSSTVANEFGENLMRILSRSDRSINTNRNRNKNGPLSGGGGGVGGSGAAPNSVRVSEGGGRIKPNLDRNERSANLSHITGSARKIQLYIKNRYLQILPDASVNGTQDEFSDYSEYRVFVVLNLTRLLHLDEDRTQSGRSHPDQTRIASAPKLMTLRASQVTYNLM